MSNDSTLVRQEQCPFCAREGRDRSHNNLAVYSDGHSYCFGGHGLISGGDKITQYKGGVDFPVVHHEVVLPEDCSADYPQRCIDWVGQYELTVNDLLSHNVLWSEQWQRLIFPIFGSEGRLLAWQGRYFGEEQGRGKWFTTGDVKTVFNILGEGDTFVLVEDIVSAIKVSRYVSAMPLYGCSVGSERFSRLSKICPRTSKFLVWLDPDKRKEAVTEARRGRLQGLDVSPIFSDKDPKEMTYEQIKEILNEHKW
jgi:hypothetical protein